MIVPRKNRDFKDIDYDYSLNSVITIFLLLLEKATYSYECNIMNEE